MGRVLGDHDLLMSIVAFVSFLICLGLSWSMGRHVGRIEGAQTREELIKEIERLDYQLRNAATRINFLHAELDNWPKKVAMMKLQLDAAQGAVLDMANLHPGPPKILKQGSGVATFGPTLQEPMPQNLQKQALISPELLKAVNSLKEPKEPKDDSQGL